MRGPWIYPSCLGRKMASRTLNLTECVLPPVPLRQWVLTFPFGWRSRLGFDAALFSALARLFVQTVLAFYTERMKKAGIPRGQTGAVVALQRTSSDLRLNPHLHVLFLDGVYQEDGENVVFHALPHLSTREVGSVLERVVRRIERFLKKRGLLRAGDSDVHDDEDPDGELTLEQGHAALCASAASGKSPPAGPEFRRKTTPLVPLASKALSFVKPLCASLDDFTLHAATRVGGLDTRARESLIKYVLRPPVAQERVTAGPDGLVRIALKRPERSFLPSPGRIERLVTPAGPGVRDDGGAYPGCDISSYYDPLISKLCVWAPTREHAIARMRRALEEYIVTGIRTNLAFHQKLLEHPDFIAGQYDTGFIERYKEQLLGYPSVPEASREAFAVAVAIAAARMEGAAGQTSRDAGESGSRLSPWVASQRARLRS